MKQATITDLAKILNLSASTISRALNDHPDIKDETKEKIRALAKELKYEPNIIARNLKARYTNQIGVIVPEIKHNFFAEVISGIEEEAYKNGFTVVVAQSNEEYEREKINANSLYLNRVAGLLVSLAQSTKDVKHFEYLIEKGVKTVFFDRACYLDKSDRVINDDFLASSNAVEHLIETGRKKIVHLAGPQTLQNCSSRLKGYQQALVDSNLTSADNMVLYGGMHEKDGANAVRNLIENNIKFDAIFAVNDPVAIGALLELKKQNIKVPSQVAVIGFSNNPVTEYVDPPLTSVDQSAHEMGKKAAEILIGRIKGHIQDQHGIETIISTKLIKRKSTE